MLGSSAVARANDAARRFSLAAGGKNRAQCQMHGHEVGVRLDERFKNVACAGGVVLSPPRRGEQEQGMWMPRNGFQDFARLFFRKRRLVREQTLGMGERGGERAGRRRVGGLIHAVDLKIAPEPCQRLPRRSLMISCAALCPGAPLTPPPGWVPDPHI